MNIEATYETAPVKTITITLSREEALMVHAVIGSTSAQQRINAFYENIPEENRGPLSPKEVDMMAREMAGLYRKTGELLKLVCF